MGGNTQSMYQVQVHTAYLCTIGSKSIWSCILTKCPKKGRSLKKSTRFVILPFRGLAVLINRENSNNLYTFFVYLHNFKCYATSKWLDLLCFVTNTKVFDIFMFIFTAVTNFWLFTFGYIYHRFFMIFPSLSNLALW